MAVEQLITQHIDIWTSTLRTRSTAGRGTSGKIDLYGIKKLRELILELAVRGKLVPQDPNDEPASELLKRIAAEKAELVKQGKIKKQKSLPEISEDEKPFELPVGWEWVRLGDVASVKGGKRLPSGHSYSEIPTPYIYIRITDMKNGTIKNYNLCYINKETRDLISNYTIDDGDLYITIAGTIGQVGIVPTFFKGMNLTENAAKLTSFLINKVWLKETISSGFLNRQFIEKTNTLAQPKLALNQISDSLIPLPPLLEQEAIQVKITQLMSLCDQLEQQSLTSLEAHSQLVETLLTTLTDSQNAEELADNWTRISQNFDTLFTTEASINALKQTILQMAVMGKLVPQDPTDEPASELLKRIEQEKAQLVKEGKIKKQKPLPPISDEEKPFKLPEGWVWARVGDILSLKNGYAFKSNYFVDSKREYVLTTPGNFYETGGFRYRGDKTKYYDGPLDAEFILSSGDLIIPMTEQAPGLLGSAAFIPNDEYIYLHNQRLGKLELYYEGVTSNFIFWFFNSQLLRVELARTCTGTTVRHTSPDRVLSALVSVVPSNEQHRITAKINKLMTLCDTLKSRLQSAQQTQLHLADALTDAALN